MSYPAGPRIIAAVGALGVAAYFGVNHPLVLLDSGYPLSAYLLVAVTVPLVAFLGLFALAPAALQVLLRRVSRVDLADRGHGGALLLMAITLYFVIGYASLVGGLLAYESEVVQGEPAASIDGTALLIGLAFNLVVLVAPPLIYVAFVNGAPQGAFAALGFRMEGAGRALLIGFASALAVLIAIAAVSFVVQGLAIEVPENERALDIARSVTVLGALGIAVASALSEEVFFRGFLQPRIGLVGQAVVFALAHLSYVNVLQIVVTFALGLVFGLIYRKTGNLWAPIAGHFLFNLLMLLAGIYAPETS